MQVLEAPPPPTLCFKLIGISTAIAISFFLPSLSLLNFFPIAWVNLTVTIKKGQKKGTKVLQSHEAPL